MYNIVAFCFGLFEQSVVVEVNGSVVNHEVGHDLVTLNDTAFTPAMDNLVEVKYEGDLLTRHVIRSQRRLDKPIVEVGHVDSVSVSVSVSVSASVNVSVHLHSGA